MEAEIKNQEPRIKNEAWTYPSGLVSALEGRLLTHTATVDLLAIGQLDELLARLRQTLLFADLAETAEPFALAESMDACHAAAVRDMAAACPASAVADLFLVPIEWRAFRAYLRAEVADQPRREVGEAVTPEAVWQQCWASAEVEPPHQHFADAADAVRAAEPREEHNERLVDEITHIHEARHLADLAAQTASEAIAAWVATWLRLRLALAVLRCRFNEWGHVRAADALDDLGVGKPEIMALASADHPEWRTVLGQLGLPAAEAIPEDESLPAAVVERLIDDAVTDVVRAGRGIPFGPEPVFAFLWALRTEATNLRLLATGVAAGLPRDLIAADMRQTHV